MILTLMAFSMHSASAVEGYKAVYLNEAGTAEICYVQGSEKPRTNGYLVIQLLGAGGIYGEAFAVPEAQVKRLVKP